MHLAFLYDTTSYWPKQVTAELRVRKGRDQDFTGKGKDLGTTLINAINTINIPQSPPCLKLFMPSKTL